MAKTVSGYCVLKLDTKEFHAAIKKAKSALTAFGKECKKRGIKPSQAARLMRMSIATKPARTAS